MSRIKGVSESLAPSTVLEKTGHDLEYWTGVLDRFDRASRGHTAAANHLHEMHGVSYWWAQQLTIYYEQIKGLRKPGERSAGKFSVNVSRTIAATVEEAWSLVSTPEGWNRWFTSKADFAAEPGQPYRNADHDVGVFLKVVPPHAPNSYGEVARIEFTWDRSDPAPGSRVSIQILQKASGKATVALTHDLIPSEADCASLKEGWTACLDKLKALFLAK